MLKQPIRSASGTFCTTDVEGCTSKVQLRLWRNTVQLDILSIEMQLDKWGEAPDPVEGWEGRANCCLKLQKMLLLIVERRLLQVENHVN